MYKCFVKTPEQQTYLETMSSKYATRWHPGQYSTMAPYSNEVSPSAPRRNVYLNGPVFENKKIKKQKMKKSKYDTINPPKEREHLSASIMSSMMNTPMPSITNSRRGSFGAGSGTGYKRKKHRAPPPPSDNYNRRTSMGSMGSSENQTIRRYKKKRMAPQPPLPRVVSQDVVYEPPIDYEMDNNDNIDVVTVHQPPAPPIPPPTPPPLPVTDIPPPPPLPTEIVEKPAPVMRPRPKPLPVEEDMHAKLKAEIILAAEARSKRVENTEVLIPERPKNIHDEMLKQISNAIDERNHRRAKGNLKMTVRVGKSGKSMYFQAPVKPVVKVEKENIKNTEDDATIENPSTEKPEFSKIFDPTNSESKKSSGKSLKSKMKKSMKNAIGSIGRSLSRLKNVKNIINNDEWEIHYPETYDKPPANQEAISIHHIEKRPAYAYHPEKEQLVLLPDYDRVIVTEDGRRFREAELSSIEKSKKEEKSVNVTPIILGDDDIKKTIKIKHQHKDNETIDKEFEWARHLNIDVNNNDNDKPERQQTPTEEYPLPPSVTPETSSASSQAETVSMKTDSDRGQSPKPEEPPSIPNNSTNIPYYNSLPGFVPNPMLMNPMMYNPYLPYGNPYIMPPPHYINPALLTQGMSPYGTLERPISTASEYPTSTIVDTSTGNTTLKVSPNTEPTNITQPESTPSEQPLQEKPAATVVPPTPPVVKQEETTATPPSIPSPPIEQPSQPAPTPPSIPPPSMEQQSQPAPTPTAIPPPSTEQPSQAGPPTPPTTPQPPPEPQDKTNDSATTSNPMIEKRKKEYLNGPIGFRPINFKPPVVKNSNTADKETAEIQPPWENKPDKDKPDHQPPKDDVVEDLSESNDGREKDIDESVDSKHDKDNVTNDDNKDTSSNEGDNPLTNNQQADQSENTEAKTSNDEDS